MQKKYFLFVCKQDETKTLRRDNYEAGGQGPT